jgi:hypothetical protein
MERKIGDIKDKKLNIENITLAAIYNILFTNDIVCSLIVEMLSALRKSELCRFRIKQQGNKLEYLARQYEKKINKIAGHRAFFMADANQYIADEVQPDLLKMEYSIKMEFDKCRIENSALLAKVELTRCMAELACLSLDKRIEEVRSYNKEVTGITYLRLTDAFKVLDELSDILYRGGGTVTSIKTIIAKGVWLSYNENLLIAILSAAQSMNQTS